MAFSLCGACARHVRTADAACPFCGATSARRDTPRLPRRRSRSAMIGAAAVALACGGSSPGDDGGTDAKDDGIQSLDAAYGGPPFDSGTDSLQGAYGGPPVDAGLDAADASDSSGQALYGAPPPPEGQ